MAAKKKVTKTKGGSSAIKNTAIGAGLAGLAAGAYYFLGPNGKKHQKKATAWMVKMEKEAKKQVSKIKDVSGPAYAKAVDALAATYSKQYKEHAPELKAFAKHLKTQWQATKSKAKPVTKKVKAAVKKAVKKVS